MFRVVHKSGRLFRNVSRSLLSNERSLIRSSEALIKQQNQTTTKKTTITTISSLNQIRNYSTSSNDSNNTLEKKDSNTTNNNNKVDRDIASVIDDEISNVMNSDTPKKHNNEQRNQQGQKGQSYYRTRRNRAFGSNDSQSSNVPSNNNPQQSTYNKKAAIWERAEQERFIQSDGGELFADKQEAPSLTDEWKENIRKQFRSKFPEFLERVDKLPYIHQEFLYDQLVSEEELTKQQVGNLIQQIQNSPTPSYFRWLIPREAKTDPTVLSNQVSAWQQYLNERDEQSGVLNTAQPSYDPTLAIQQVDLREFFEKMQAFDVSLTSLNRRYHSLLKEQIEMLSPGEAVLEIQLRETEKAEPWDSVSVDTKAALKRMMVARAEQITPKDVDIFAEWFLAPKLHSESWKEPRALTDDNMSHDLYRVQTDFTNQTGLKIDEWWEKQSKIPMLREDFEYKQDTARAGRRTLADLKLFEFYPEPIRRWLEDIKWPRGSFRQDGKFVPLISGRGSLVPDLHPVQRSIVKIPPPSDPSIDSDLAGHYRFGIEPSEIEAYPEKIKQLMSMQHASEHEKRQFRIQRAIKVYQSSQLDTGSDQVTAAVLSEKIKSLEKHFTTNKQDKKAKRELQRFKDQRRKIFKQLKASNPEAYYRLLKDYSIVDEINPLNFKRSIPAPLRLEQVVKTQ